MANRIGVSGALTHKLPGVLVIAVAIIGKRADRYEPLDEQILNFDEKPKFGNADDESIELIADFVLHELDFLPLDQLAFGFIGATLGHAGVHGDLMQLLKGNDFGDVLVGF